MSKSGYDVYLSKCLLPITPAKIQIKISNQNNTITLIDGMEINLLKDAGLTEIEFECLLPMEKYPFSTYKSKFKKPSYFLDYFEMLKVKKKPFQFLVIRRPFVKNSYNTNIKVSMEDYKITEDAKDGLDIKVSIKLKQYRNYGTKICKIKVVNDRPRASNTGNRPTDNSPEPDTSTTYTVVSGDCLWNIAKRFYGNGAQYTVIYNANIGVVGGNPNLIYPGQVLTIPAI